MKIVLLASFLALLGAAPANAARTCTAADLTGSFLYLPGSAGAGNVVYTLQLVNRSRQACSVAIRGYTLLDKSGHALPSHPAGLAKTVALSPGRKLTASARFSPDVPGVGEQHAGACERTAYRLRIAGAVVAISPPTAVCERGSLNFRF